MGVQIFPTKILGQLSAGVTAALFVPLLYYTLAATGITLSLWQNADIHQDSKIIHDHTKTFDFIVVGAGSAGCIVASRLSKYYDVLLLEAGGEPNPLQSIPGFSLFMINYPETDWMHRSVPQKYASLNSVNQESSWSAGRGLGGTGNINLLLYLRGNPRDFDNWARITGDQSWSYDEMLPHFKNLEHYGDPNGDPQFHGFSGELGVELPEYTGLAEEFVKAGQEFGFPEIDINAPHKEGFFKLFYSTKRGTRHTSYTAFIKPVRARKSLTIMKYSLVTKIIFQNDKEVHGVEFIRHGKTYKAIATKEVIVSAGATTTPKLLMLSGIGPKDHLEELGIPVLHDLPVGKNLQDHLAVYLNPIFIDQPRTLYMDRDITPAAFVQWFTSGSGTLSSSGAQASGVFSSSFAKNRGEGDWPDLQFFFFGISVFKTFAQSFAKAFGLKEDEMVRYYEHAIGKESFLISISGARPLSRGYIKLGGSSPHDKVVIDPNYLNDPFGEDLKVLLEGTKAALRLVENSTTFQSLNAKYTDVPLPGCEHLPFRSDEYWVCYIRRYTVTLHHPSGTSCMGPPGATWTSVVDPELRVHGVNNLRVVDASVMPVIVVTNTMAAANVIGEKGAAMILKFWHERDLNRDPPHQY